MIDFKNHKWSYSSLSCFERCPLAFKLRYIQGFKDEESAFTQYGKFVHSILEKYYKHELELFDLADVYKNGYYDMVTEDFPTMFGKSLEDIYYDAGEEYFTSFEDEFFDYKIVDVEKKFVTKIGDSYFTGVIDLILTDGKDYFIVDHKSKGKFKSKKEHSEYLRQLYLYAKYIYDTYKKYPKQLIFNLIRSGETIWTDFNMKDYKNTLKWCSDLIEKIKNEKSFDDKHMKDADKYKIGSDFYCSQLCSMRTLCVRSDAF